MSCWLFSHSELKLDLFIDLVLGVFIEFCVLRTRILIGWSRLNHGVIFCDCLQVLRWWTGYTATWRASLTDVMPVAMRVTCWKLDSFTTLLTNWHSPSSATTSSVIISLKVRTVLFFHMTFWLHLHVELSSGHFNKQVASSVTKHVLNIFIDLTSESFICWNNTHFHIMNIWWDNNAQTCTNCWPTLSSAWQQIR